MIDLESDVNGSNSESQQTSQSGPGPETPPPAKQPSLVTAQCDDVANFVGARICSGEKYQLLTKHLKPGPEYIFLWCSSRRYFQHRWLQQYPWLVYSKRENGGFCMSPLCSLLI